MITFKQGNIFDSKAEALVNPVNCVGVSGKGLALEFKKRFPLNFDKYRDACKQPEEKLKIGRIFITVFYDSPKYIINFTTKNHWRETSFISYINEGLKDLKRFLTIGMIKSIAIPALGCGLGELPWHMVKESIIYHLSDLEDIDIEVYEPHEDKK